MKWLFVVILAVLLLSTAESKRKRGPKRNKKRKDFIVGDLPVSTSTTASSARKRFSAVAWLKDVNSNNAYGYICGGAWISQNWVITVTACLREHNLDTKSEIKSNVKVNLRDLYLDQTGESCASGDLDVIDVHVNADFTLLQVSNPPTDLDGDCGGPAPLDCQQASWAGNDKQEVHVAGWGVYGTEGSLSNQLSKVLRFTTITAWKDNAKCENKFGSNTATNDHLCARLRGTTSYAGNCYGDKGSPVLSSHGYRLVALADLNPANCAGTFSAHLKIDTGVCKWIFQKIGCDMPGKWKQLRNIYTMTFRRDDDEEIFSDDECVSNYCKDGDRSDRDDPKADDLKYAPVCVKPVDSGEKNCDNITPKCSKPTYGLDHGSLTWSDTVWGACCNRDKNADCPRCCDWNLKVLCYKMLNDDGDNIAYGIKCDQRGTQRPSCVSIK